MGIAQNAVSNMAEDLTMMIGYSTVNEFMNKMWAKWFPDEVDENGQPKMNIAREVLSGGASYLFMSVMMKSIQQQEKYVEYLFAGAKALIIVLHARNQGYFDKMASKLTKLKGVQAIAKFNIFKSQHDHQNTFVSQVYQTVQTILQGETATRDVAQTLMASNAQSDTAVNRERINFEMAQAQNQSFHNSMVVKMATAGFTNMDKKILQKVIGRTDYDKTPINIDELNQVRDFMLSTDSNGNLIGLTKGFTDFINGFGFSSKKVA